MRGSCAMHRMYNPVLPCSNKKLQMRWDQTYYDEHRRKVKTAATVLDTRPPKTFMHLHLRLKKLQLEEERLAIIERDNRILLEKMAQVMRTTGRVDNRNDYTYRSLNREKRQRELLRITRENQEILRRIMLKKPDMNKSRWQADWRQTLKYMDNISSFPENWWLYTPDGKLRKSRTAASKRQFTFRSTDDSRPELDAAPAPPHDDEEDETAAAAAADDSADAADSAPTAAADAEKPASPEAEADAL